jgi:hypothetical protein
MTTSHPAQYIYDCPECGNVEYDINKYPSAVICSETVNYKKMYEATLQTAKQWIADGCTDKEKIAIETIFPELRESEDERIRKMCITAVNIAASADGGLLHHEAKQCLDWLEKQKEKIEVNLNDCVEVVLTKRGAKSLNERIQRNVPADQRANYKEGDTYTDQLWAIIRYFAEDMGCGFDMPFSGIKILKIDNGLEKQKESNIEHIQRSWYMQGYHDRENNREPKWIITAKEGGPRYEDNPRYGESLEQKQKLCESEDEKRMRAIAVLEQQRYFWSYEGPVDKTPPATKRKDLVEAIDVVLAYLEKQKENKAKAYDEAIRKAQDVYHTSEFIKITDLFPVLAKRNEDDEYLDEAEQKYWREERQQEQKPDTRDADDLQLLDFIYDLLNEIEWKDSWAMSKEECLRRLNDYRPQKPASISCGHENDKSAEWSDDIIRKAVKEVGLTQHQIDWFKTNVFPPKQEWSEEDELMRTAILNTLDRVGDYGTIGMQKDWLKSLPLNLKKKNEDVAKLCSNEWSEEDEKVLNSIIAYIETGNIYATSKVNMKVWLKSLRPQPKWKPSEEQMEALDEYIYAKVPNTGKYSKAVLSLRDKLKKLM